jgi:hypothetical protein
MDKNKIITKPKAKPTPIVKKQKAERSPEMTERLQSLGFSAIMLGIVLIVILLSMYYNYTH